MADFRLVTDFDELIENDENEEERPQKRFKPIDPTEQQRLLHCLTAESTKRATRRSVNTFEAWVQESGHPPVSWESISQDELAVLLKDFWFGLRTTTGDFYKSNTMQNIRHGLNRHLKELKREMDIVNGPAFVEPNIHFKAQMRELKRTGKGDTRHHEPLTEVDLAKTYEYFKTAPDNPVTLQRKVWFDLCLHLLRRGRENLRELTVDHFTISTDSSDNRYVYQSMDEQTKNHQTDDSRRQGRMYEVVDNPQCPVKSYERYVSMLHRDSRIFFQQPNRDSDTVDMCWYHKRPMGHNVLGNMMASISDDAKLSRRYTNHCLRTTSVTLLDSAKFPCRHIMTVSGHKSETSLKNYAHHTSEKTKREMSHTLNKSLGLTAVVPRPPPQTPLLDIDVPEVVEPRVEPAVPDPNVPMSSRTPQPTHDVVQPINSPTAFPSFLPDEISNDILRAIELPTTNIVTSLDQVENRSSFQCHAPFITNSSVSINYNFYAKP